MHRTVEVSPGRGASRGRRPKTLFSTGIYPYTALMHPHPSRASGAPPPPGGAGAVQVIAPERRARGACLDFALPRRHPMHRTVGISPGEGSGREPPRRRQKPYWPFPRAPAQERGQYRREPWRGTSPGRRTRIPLSSLPHPARASGAPPPPQAGAVQVISPERPARGVGPRSRPSPASSHAPDRGDSIVGEGTPSPSGRTILALPLAPAQERALSW